MSNDPEISKYFDNNSSHTEETSFFDEISKSGSKTVEPDVCKLFTSDPVVKSDGVNFFDMIGSTATSLGDVSSDNTISGTTLSAEDNLFLGGKQKESFIPVKKASESDRMHSAWIPPDTTRKALMSMITSPPGSYNPDRETLTMPGVILDEEMKDTVYEAVLHYLGEAEASKRKVLTASDVTQDERGLRDLIQAGCFRAAVNLTGRLLTMYGQGAGRAGHPSKHTVHSIQLWFTRLALLVKLRSFSLAQLEAEPFGDLDQPDMFFQYYPELYGGRTGSIVPFSFRLLLADLPSSLEKHQQSLVKLYSMLATVKKMLNNLNKGLCEDGTPIELKPADRAESIKLWTTRDTRIRHSIVNCALSYKDYNLALEVLQTIISRESNENQARLLKSALGRVLLQLGDVVGAQKTFSSTKLNTPDLRNLVDASLVAIALDNFQEGYDLLLKALELDPSNVMALNNMSVCLLYMGKLKQAIQLLEECLAKHPSLSLHESFLLNLCTLYELETSYSIQAKLKLLALVSQHKGDNLTINCLKLQM